MVLVGPGEGQDLLEGVPVVALWTPARQDVHAHAGARIEREPNRSSVVLPAGTDSRSPSLRALTAPRTATVSTIRG